MHRDTHAWLKAATRRRLHVTAISLWAIWLFENSELQVNMKHGYQIMLLKVSMPQPNNFVEGDSLQAALADTLRSFAALPTPHVRR
ncbi:hypothetical protein THICB2_280058 [Thiomonas sp. CB2]|nr:hypothetical protein THICB2_280058 [Thiomonas sp. CB2]VDY05438.1 protein of unknown function [Thiomonas sp. Bio17B3]VDY07399.1 protein of unknown function [Thiomonas sp. Sup16B3]VDY13688.1 conserved protein of unknown function [Thiomonas sp. OC7]VDY17112.1 protein of unknown function [Thiomonas sp. CB2]